ncbi:hypothetical protein MFIFM68171_10238 [Madurella fahalii]|uniref:Uncharacterized protein n=1 Tax=Madurella fahalii TaxID=1157608 RepID=A0ABQ0GQL4_9PEZI
MHLSFVAPILAFLPQRSSSSSPPLSHRQPNGDITVDPGYWNLTLARGNPASGYRWENLDAVYSGAPDTVIHCKELYDPNTQTTTRSCDEPSFRYAVGPLAVEGTWILVLQTVQIDISGSGMSTPLLVAGDGTIDIQCGKGAAGRSCEGFATVKAVLQDATEGRDMKKIMMWVIVAQERSMP